MDQTSLKKNRRHAASLLNVPGYDPLRFFDFAKSKLGVTTDGQLTAALSATRPSISRMRHRKLPISASMLIRFHEKTGVPFPVIREELGIAPDALL